MLTVLDQLHASLDSRPRPEDVAALILETGEADRLDHRVRKARGIELSRRRYNRAWRFLAGLGAKAARMENEARKRELTLAGRSGLAEDITAEGFRRDPAAACFVAYFVARRKLRREFTLSGRVNPMDEVADMLLRRLGNGSEWG